MAASCTYILSFLKNQHFMGLGPMEAYTTFKVVLNETLLGHKWINGR